MKAIDDEMMAEVEGADIEVKPVRTRRSFIRVHILKRFRHETTNYYPFDTPKVEKALGERWIQEGKAKQMP